MAHVLAKDLREAVLNSALNGGLTTTIDTDKNVWENGIENIESNEYDVPDTWKLITIGSITNIKNGFTPKRTVAEYWNSKDIPWFTVDDIHDQGHEIRETVQYISNKALGKNSTRIIKPNTVLLCCTSATIGNYAITRLPVTTNQQWNGLEVKEEYSKEIISEFILIWAMTLKNKMISVAGSTTFPFLSTKKLSDFPIPLPPIEEQARIVARVDELMAKIDEYEKFENELAELKKNFPGDMKAAVIQAAIEGKLTNSEESYLCYEDMPFDLPEEWEWKSLDSVVECKRGKGLSKNSIDNGEIPIILYGQLYTTYIDDISTVQSFTSDKNALNCPFAEKGDILLPITSTSPKAEIGRPVIYDCDDLCYFGSDMISLKTSLSSKYLSYVLSSGYFNKLKMKNVNGITIKHLGVNGFLAIPIPVPPIEEQKRIVEKLDKLLPLCEELEKEIA